MSFLLSGYFAYMISFLAIYSALAVVLHLQVFRAGIVNFGIVGFWGLGMYITAIFLLRLDMPFFVALILASIITGLISIPLAKVILNLDGEAVLVGTLAFATIIENLVMGNKDLTGGSIGIGTISIPINAGQYSQFVYALLIVGFLVLLMWYASRIKNAPYGRLLLSIKDNEQLSRSLGKPTLKHKIVIFSITCGVLAFFGGLTAPLYSHLYPMMITPAVTFTAWIALIVGGQARISGAVVGVIATVFLFEYLLMSIIPLPAATAQIVPFLKYVAYGLMLVLLLMFKPSGILGDKKKGSKPKGQKVQVER